MARHWGEVTSSVNFCEGDYELSPFVAEPANTISSMFMVILGVIGYFSINNRRNDPSKWAVSAFGCCYGGLAVVGVGSMLLHATLRAGGQACDEVPMVLLNDAMIFILIELGTSGALPSHKWLPTATVILAVLKVGVYFLFQHLYEAFLAVYVTGVAVLIIWTGNIALTTRLDFFAETTRRNVVLPLWRAAMICYLGMGFFAWVTDFLFCEQIKLYLGTLGTMLLHPVWHFGAGTATWLTFQMLAAARGELLPGLVPRIEWFASVLPYTTFVPASPQKRNLRRSHRANKPRPD